MLAHIAKSAAESSYITDRDAITSFRQLTCRAKDVLEEAQTLIRSKLVTNPESLNDESVQVKIRKVRFLWEENKLAEINARLSDVHQSMAGAINSISVSEIQRMRMTLENVQFRLVAFDDRYRQASEATAAGRVYEIDETSRSLAVDDDSSAHTPVESAEPSVALPPQLDTETISALGQFATHQDSLPEETTSSSTQIQVEVTVAEDLLSICGCSCHTPLAVRTPAWLGNAVGVLLVRWYRSPGACVRCSIRACKAERRQTLSTRYFFPWWMMRRLVDFEAGWRSTQRLALTLRTTNVIPDDSTVFLFAQHNNIDGIKRLFEQRLASPFDVSLRGRTPLHVRGILHIHHVPDVSATKTCMT